LLPSFEDGISQRFSLLISAIISKSPTSGSIALMNHVLAFLVSVKNIPDFPNFSIESLFQWVANFRKGKNCPGILHHLIDLSVKYGWSLSHFVEALIEATVSIQYDGSVSMPLLADCMTMIEGVPHQV
jgi:hypothetical protein